MMRNTLHTKCRVSDVLAMLTKRFKIFNVLGVSEIEGF